MQSVLWEVREWYLSAFPMKLCVSFRGSPWAGFFCCDLRPAHLDVGLGRTIVRRWKETGKWLQGSFCRGTTEALTAVCCCLTSLHCVCIHCDHVALPLLAAATAGAWIAACSCDLCACHCWAALSTLEMHSPK